MKRVILLLGVFVLFYNCSVTNAGELIKTTEAGDEYDIIPKTAEFSEMEIFENGLVLYTYIDSDFDKEIVPRSINARQGKKYYRYILAGQDVVVLELSANFSYGHSDGIVRVTNAQYQVLKVDSSWGVGLSNLYTSTSNGNPGCATLHHSVTYNGSTTSGSTVLCCNNNGNIY